MELSGLISIVVVLVILGVCLWLVETYIPMAAPFPMIIRVVVAIFFVLWLLSLLGVWHGGVALRH